MFAANAGACCCAEINHVQSGTKAQIKNIKWKLTTKIKIEFRSVETAADTKQKDHIYSSASIAANPCCRN